MDKCVDEGRIYLSDKVRKQLEEDLGFSKADIGRLRLGHSTHQDVVKACGHTQVSNMVLCYPGISPTAKTLYILLLKYAWIIKGLRKNYVFPTMRTLGKFLGRSQAQVIKYLKELVKAELIFIIDRGRKFHSNKRACNVYIIRRIPKEIVEWYDKNVLGND